MNGVVDVQYVRFNVEDLARQQRFLNDFGLTTELRGETLIGRAGDGQPYVYIATRGANAFLGMGFRAESAQALARIAAIDGVSVESITELPGGGAGSG